ncbi:hypothetical protein UFOVP641_31 [uncultured Caudovirales phage]|uniref:Uncharacterized protein n=1 Tax=uncultured Caudovirales phage TaxID=2100421 RepID=A0A6J5N4V0_9CAUD|nr:hypothetical protein UFOVP641_31 [uncultured Caudovirales phage]
MAGTYPTSPAFNAVNFKVITPTLTTRTIDGNSRRVGMGHSYYSFTARHQNLTRGDAGIIQGFVVQQFGQVESFQIELPELSYSKSSNLTTGPVLTNGAIVRGARSVNVSGVTSGKNFLRAGDFFKFGNHTKVYQCTVTWTTGQPLYFSGGLVADVPNGTGITYGKSAEPVLWTVMFESDIQQWDTGIGGIVNMSLDMREVW